MGSINLTFNDPLNTSLTPGDVAFFKDTVSGDIYQIGEVTAIVSDINMVICNIPDSYKRPGVSDFIFFVKDSEINTSGLVGYFASVKMELDGNVKKELYAVSTEMHKSS